MDALEMFNKCLDGEQRLPGFGRTRVRNAGAANRFGAVYRVYGFRLSGLVD